MCKGDKKLGVCSLAEVLYLDVPSILVEHVCGGDAALRNLASCHGEVLHSLLSVTLHANLHLSVLRPLQSAHSLVLCHHLAHKWLAVNTHNLVACQYAGTLCGSVLHHVLHTYGVLAYCELDAHTRERAFEVVCHSLCILCGDVYRVGVEVGKNLRYSHINKRVDIHLVHILVVHDVQQV